MNYILWDLMQVATSLCHLINTVGDTMPLATKQLGFFFFFFSQLEIIDRQEAQGMLCFPVPAVGRQEQQLQISCI